MQEGTANLFRATCRLGGGGCSKCLRDFQIHQQREIIHRVCQLSPEYYFFFDLFLTCRNFALADKPASLEIMFSLILE